MQHLPSSDLKYGLEKDLVILKLAIREQLLALLVVTCYDQARQDRAQVPDLRYDTLSLVGVGDDVYLVRIVGDVDRGFEPLREGRGCVVGGES